ncbi:MFS transporter [Sphingomonas oligoaromativorans]|uniref:MFS transporter n=1 Tax=Sphingomonas oligoaromativorans TaxID=575322 RepID=UPI0014227587|nr:MFS transporter [Sphingomonas oligoaromativorans]NIJ33005.1 MHS family alpha-ketoglutarate permease-like MFS transporter [Sphingomonas oligoaromativorans]
MAAPIAEGPDAPSPGLRLRSILGGAAGNLVEWYDWYAYSAFALYFAGAFFPKADQTAQLLNTAAVFAVGFVMRPVGGWLMGAFADRQGRKAGLTLSVVLMCAGALLIALCPPYARIGAAAPVVLVVARLLQGLSLGGEYGASAVYLSEMAGRRHRGFWSSFQYVTLISGQLVSLALLLVLQALLDHGQMAAWGWRIPFAIGAGLAIIVWRIRRGLAETESFRNVQRSGRRRGAVADLLGPHRREAALVLALTAGGTVAFYAWSIYMQKFLANTAGFSAGTASAIMALALLLYTALQPAAGALSDVIGRKPLMVGFGVSGVLLTVPIFTALEHVHSATGAFLLVMAGLLSISGYTSINAVVKAELFPAEVRGLGVALPYAIANALFGGTAEYVALWFKQAGLERGFYWYVTGLVAVSLIAYLRMRETKDASAIVED